VRVTNAEEPLRKVPRIEMEQEKDGQHLNQDSDTAAMLQDELIQAADRERQLQTELDKMKDDIRRLQTQLEQLSNLQKEFDDFKQRNISLWEEEMKHRDSTF